MRLPDDDAPLLAELEALCAAHPHAPKIVFVPRIQLGRALETAVARRRGGWGGLTCCLPRHYAERIAGPPMRRSGREEFPVDGQPFLVARLLQALDGAGHVDALPTPHRFAAAMAGAIGTLRLGAVPPGALRERIEADGAPATLEALAACYDGYHAVLDRHALYDDADVFAGATEEVEAGRVPLVGHSVIAVCNEVEVPASAYRFLQALQRASRAFYRLGRAGAGSPPPHTAAALFAAVDSPPHQSLPADGRQADPPVTGCRCCRAVGAVNEVKAMFRDVLARGAPFDEIEIAYTETDPYLMLIADRADRLGVPVTLSTGLPATLTRTGRALRAFYSWVTDDFDVRALIRMLRSGHLRVDRVKAAGGAPPDDTPEAHELATLLAARRYEPGREGYRKGLGAAIREKEARIEELVEKGFDATGEQRALARLRRLRAVVEALLALVPRSTSVRALAEHSKRFVEVFGPVDKPAEDTPESQHTLDEAARAVLLQRLDRLTHLPFTYEASAARLAGLFRSWVETQYVRAEHPRPGAIHVLPLESAGFGDRNHLFVVGMDSDTLATAAVEDVMLRDRDRRALSTGLEGVLPERSTAPDEALWRMAQAFARHTGTLSLYTRIVDLESGEERHPSPLFLQLENRYGNEEGKHVAGFVPQPEADVVLSDSEAWLAAYRARHAPSEPQHTARDALGEAYPWLLDGQAARRARASEVYTAHDGLLAEGAYPELDFLSDAYDGVCSAARLETLAETPYLYFLKYVLGVRPLDEPALDDEPWFNRRRRGTLLHATFEAFMQSLDGDTPSLEHEPLLREVLRAELDREVERVAPPSRVEEEAARRQLFEDARLFLRVEAERADAYTPLYHEIGFGFDAYRRRADDLGDVALPVGEHTLPLCGMVDRVDRRPDGTLAVWDYKTGSTSSFSETDPLQAGATLQWALYAYALEAVTGERVAASGYFFTSVAEMGTRLVFDPSGHRSEVEALVARLAHLARSGSFPMTPNAKNTGRWAWGGYDRLFPDLKARSDELAAKTYPEARPRPPWIDT